METYGLFFWWYAIGFLIGPGLYFYVVSVSKSNFKFRKRHLYHLIPFAIALCFSFYFLSKRRIYDQSIFSGAAFGLHLFSVFSYLIVSFIEIHSFKSNLQFYLSYSEKLKLHWLKLITISFAVLWLIAFFCLFFAVEESAQFYQSLGASMVFYTLCLFALKESDVFILDMEELNNERKKLKAKERTPEVERFISEQVKNLENHLKKEKSFKNPNLKLSDLAKEVHLSLHQLSLVINVGFGKNFFKLINGYRIDEAKELLRDPNVKILDVAYEVGFNSKSTFNTAFKDHSGFTPTEFRDLC